MDFINGVITIGLMILTLWCTVIAVGDIRLMRLAKQYRGSFRRTDLIQLIGLLISIAAAFVVLFIKPGLIYNVPSAVVCLEIGSVAALWHLSELQFKNLHRIRDRISHQ